jgi:List-Bact-rpt repeat protein
MGLARIRGTIGVGVVVAALALAASPAIAATTTVGFDNQPGGTAIGEQYAALGVHFGPSPFQGQSGGFTADARAQARSAPNVAAFAYDPGTDFSSSWIKFDRQQSSVSFYACRTGGAGDPPRPNVNVVAYDSNGNVVDTQNGTSCTLNGTLVPVAVQSAHISYLNVSGTGGSAAPGPGWGLDDLSFDTNPPPQPPPPARRTLTVSTSGTGSGRVTSAGIDCGAGHSACSTSVADGTLLTLTATPVVGSLFAGFAGGGCGSTSPCTVTMNANQTVDARFDQVPPPRNVTGPSIYWSLYRDRFVCNPGAWANLPANPAFSYEWLRRSSGVGTGRRTSVVATTQSYNPNGSQRLFACRVTARNAGGAVAVTSDFRRLVPLAVPTFPYGNFRIRGIDVFQVVQPTSCAQTFGYLPNAAFPCLQGGGTPNSYLRFGRITGDHQHASYLGVPIDADKPTTAVVYVDSTEALASASQALDVTLLARYNGRQIGSITLTRRITNPPLSSTPWVTAAERSNQKYGVQFQIPAIWLQVPGTLGGALDLQANVRLPIGTSKLIAECNAGRDCSSDDTFRLNGVPSQHVTPLNVRTVELLGANQTLGSITAPDRVLFRARQVYPGGDGMEVSSYYSAWLGVVNQEALTATSVAPNPGEVAPVFTCNSVRYASSAAAAATVANATRSCRSGAVGAVVARWETANPGSGYDLTAMMHNYLTAPGGTIEPGWTPTASNGSLATVQPKPGEYVRPLILINDGSANRPLTAAAHEFGHALGMPHAELFPYANKAMADCGGSTGGQMGEAWPPDNEGRLQGVKFDQLRLGFGRVKDFVPVVDGQGASLFDLMSYCAPNKPETNTWLSARNWNRAFRTLLDYEGRLSAAAADPASAGSSAATSGSRQAFAVGVVGSGGGRIDRIVAPHGNDLIPVPVPSSPLRLRAFDPAGRTLEDVGVMIQGPTFAGAPAGGGTFVGPVPADAASVELVRDGVVLDRKLRNRPPRVRLLAPTQRTRTRAHGKLLVRWSASDPDRDALQATVDYSPDAGRTWRTVYDGPSIGHAVVPGSFLEGSTRARIRVYVNDGFNEARAVSPRFRAAGTAPIATIVRPDAGEPVRGGESTLLIGSAFDDRHHRLRGRALTWYAGRGRLGTGEQLKAKLPSGRIVLRLLARDQSGRQTLALRILRVAPPALRLLQMNYADRVRHGGRTLTVRISVTAPATLTVSGQRYGVGSRPRSIRVPLPNRPASGLLKLRFTLTPRGAGAGSIDRGTIMVVRQ